jgi:hypothetical protein
VNRPLALGITVACVFAAVLLAFLWAIPADATPAALAVLTSVPASLITAVLIYLFQKPDFAVLGGAFVTEGHKPGEDLAAVTAWWIHVNVLNTSRGLLGGGTASGVSGKMVFEDGRTFRTKWEAKDNPLGVALRLLPDGRVAQILYPDRFRIPTVRQDVLAAGESKSLDIAVKWKGDPNAYIWDPMVFEKLDYTDSRLRFGPGEAHRFDLFAEWAGESRHLGKFILEVADGDGPSSLKVTRAGRVRVGRSEPL